MKYTIISLFILSFFDFQRANAQQNKIKQDTVYYKLDTSSVPIKDRMFSMDQEASFKEYILLCKCDPWGNDLVFYSNIDRPNETKTISKETFNQIKTISITRLIEIWTQYGKDRINKYKMFFIIPDAKRYKMTNVYLFGPRKPQKPSECGVIIPPPEKKGANN